MSAPQGVAGHLGKDFVCGARRKVDEFKFGLAEKAKRVPDSVCESMKKGTNGLVSEHDGLVTNSVLAACVVVVEVLSKLVKAPMEAATQPSPCGSAPAKLAVFFDMQGMPSHKSCKRFAKDQAGAFSAQFMAACSFSSDTPFMASCPGLLCPNALTTSGLHAVVAVPLLANPCSLCPVRARDLPGHGCCCHDHRSCHHHALLTLLLAGAEVSGTVVPVAHAAAAARQPVVMCSDLNVVTVQPVVAMM